MDEEACWFCEKQKNGESKAKKCLKEEQTVMGNTKMFKT